MMWMYDIPTWALGIFVVGSTVVAALGGFFLLHALVPGERSEEGGGKAVTFIGIICAFHSLLLAFSAVLVWQDFTDSEKSVAVEAYSVDNVFRDLAVFGGPNARAAADTLREYVRVVIDEEWPLMARGEASPKAWALVNEAFRKAGSLEPATPREEVIFYEIFFHVNQLLNNRHARLTDSQSEMPGLFWVIVLLATALLIAYTGMLPKTSVNVTMIAGMSAAIGLIFFFIVALDHPFSGEASVEPKPFEEILAQFEGNWGRVEAKP